MKGFAYAIAMLLLLSVPVFAQEQVAVLVSDNPADLAVAKVLAEKLDATLVVTPWGTLSQEAVEKIEASGAQVVYVVGGEVAVPDAEEVLDVEVRRLAGRDRYHTAALVARLWGTAERAVMVYGYDEEGIQEALENAMRMGMPLLFVKPDEVPEEVEETLSNLTCREVMLVPAPLMMRERLRERLREKGVEKFNETQVDARERAKRAIERAEEAIERAEETLNVENLSYEELDGRKVAALRLLIRAKRHLEAAEDAFEDGNYGMAFGMAVAAKANAEAALRIYEGIIVGNYRRHVDDAEREMEHKGARKLGWELAGEMRKHGFRMRMMMQEDNNTDNNNAPAGRAHGLGGR